MLQQAQAVSVWGTANPSEPITVSFQNQVIKTAADATGSWSVKLKTLKSGGWFTLTITGVPDDAVTLKNILVGDVWLASGQSNMEFGIGVDKDGKAAIAAANEPSIRLFMVPKAGTYDPQSVIRSPKPTDLLSGHWQVCAPETLAGNWG